MAKYLPWYTDAALLTLRVGALGIVLALAAGLVVAVVRYYRIPVLAQTAAIYTELSRNTPLLVQLFFLYFGLPKIGVRLSGEWCAVIGLVFLGASYMAEALRSVAMPGFVANVIFLIKEISVVSTIALPDLMYVTKDLIGNYYKTYEALLMLVVAYIIILLPVSLFGSWLERRMRHAGFGV